MKKQNDESGSALIEYALLTALVSIVAISSLQQTGTSAATRLCQAAGYVTGESQELVISVSNGCCGYNQPGLGGGFVCAN